MPPPACEGCERRFQLVNDAGADAAPWAVDGQAVPITAVAASPSWPAHLVVSSPCNAISVPVDIDGNKLMPRTDEIASGAMLCIGPAGEAENWLLGFFSQTLTVTSLADGGVELSTASDRLRLALVP